MSPAESLMTRKDTMAVLGVEDREWAMCDMFIHNNMLGDWMLNLSPKISEILDAGIDTLVYSGDKDYICNWRGGEKWTNELKWDGHSDFSTT